MESVEGIAVAAGSEAVDEVPERLVAVARAVEEMEMETEAEVVTEAGHMGDD